MGDDHLNSKSQTTSTESIICGGAAGLFSRFVMSPLDVLKIRLQLQTTKITGITKRHNAAQEARIGTVLFSTIRNILKNEGITAFWKGNVPAEFLYVFYGAAQFTSYKATNKFFNTELRNNNLPESVVVFLSGATAGLFATSITYPFDLLRTRFAADKIIERKGRGLVMIGEFTRILRNEGPRGFFVGLTPTLAGVLPYMGSFFLVYEGSREIMRSNPAIFGSISPEAVGGLVAGGVSKALVFPLDVVRKRIQTASDERLVGRSGASARKIPGYMLNIVRTEGILGLYRGFLVSLAKSGPTSAVTIWTFEKVLYLMRQLKENGYINY